MSDNWQLKALLTAVDNMSPVLKSISNTAKSARAHLAAVGTAAGNLGDKVGLPLGLMTGALAGFSGVAIKNAVVGFTDMAESAQKMALRTSMGTDEIQKLKYVAEQSGVSFDELGGSMGKLNLNLAKAATGQAPAVASLMQHLGISLRDANGQIVKGVDVLPQLADAFAANKDSPIVASMGMALFGKQWQSLMPMLAEGAQGIDNSLSRFDKLKNVIPEDTINSAKELGDKFKDLEFVTKGFQNTIAAQLVPVLSPLIEDLVQWSAANRKVIATEVKSVIQGMVESLRKIDWGAVIQGALGFARSIGTLVDFVGGAKNALILLAVVMNAQTIMALGGLVMAVGRAAIAFGAMALQAYVAANASLVSMGRIAIVAIATAGPLGALSAAYAAFAAMVSGMSGIMSGALGMVTGAFRALGAAMMANPLGIVLGLAAAAYLIYDNWGTLKEWFSSFFDWIGEKFTSIVGWALDLAQAAGELLGLSSSGSAGAPGAAGKNGAAGGSSLVGSNRVQASGQIQVSFKDAPAGLRVEQSSGGDIPINTDVGYNSYSTGMPL